MCRIIKENLRIRPGFSDSITLITNPTMVFFFLFLLTSWWRVKKNKGHNVKAKKNVLSNMGEKMSWQEYGTKKKTRVGKEGEELDDS